MAQSIGKYDLVGSENQKKPQDLEAERNPESFGAGPSDSHKFNDPKDERSIANRLAKETSSKDEDAPSDDPNIRKPDQTPTQLAESHGNKPSKGAMIDEQLEIEERAELSKKGKA